VPGSTTVSLVTGSRSRPRHQIRAVRSQDHNRQTRAPWAA
jgi:hypothetical protein